MGVEEDATARKRFLGSWRTGGGGGWGSPPSPKMLLMGDMSDENGFTPKKERPDEEDCVGGGGRLMGGDTVEDIPPLKACGVARLGDRVLWCLGILAVEPPIMFGLGVTIFIFICF